MNLFWVISDVANNQTAPGPITWRETSATTSSLAAVQTVNPSFFLIMSDSAYELELYATNVEAFIMPTVRNLAKHYKRGNFSLDKAIYAIERYCLIPAAKQYKLEHGSMTQSWHSMFPKNVRLEAAESIAKQYHAEFKLGNF